MEKAFLKIRQKIKKKTENQCQNATFEQKKPLARNEILVRTKNDASNEL